MKNMKNINVDYENSRVKFEGSFIFGNINTKD